MAQFSPSSLRRGQESGILAWSGGNGPWNEKNPPKYWKDSKAIGTTSYNGSGQNGLAKFIVPADQLEFNIPPIATEIQPYEPEPTIATSGGSLINPELLSTPTQAHAIANKIGASRVTIASGLPISWGNELRRIWQVELNGTEYNVGSLLKIQGNQQGTWAGVVFTPSPNITVTPDKPPVEWPLRDLIPPEKPVPSLLGAGWLVDDGQGTQTSSGVDYSEQLDRIEAKIDRIIKSFDVP